MQNTQNNKPPLSCPEIIRIIRQKGTCNVCCSLDLKTVLHQKVQGKTITIYMYTRFALYDRYKYTICQFMYTEITACRLSLHNAPFFIRHSIHEKQIQTVFSGFSVTSCCCQSKLCVTISQTVALALPLFHIFSKHFPLIRTLCFCHFCKEPKLKTFPCSQGIQNDHIQSEINYDFMFLQTRKFG